MDLRVNRRLFLAVFVFFVSKTVVGGVKCDHFRPTSFGEVLLVTNESMNFDQSREYCQEHGAILAPLNSLERIYEVSDMLLECDYDNDKREYVKRSFEYSFRIGLTTEGGESTWEDGEPYIELTSYLLFRLDRLPDSTWSDCENAYLSPYRENLSSMFCTQYKPFICWRSTIEQTTTIPDTTTASNETKSDKICQIEPSNSGLVIGLLSVTVAILLLLIICFVTHKLLVARKQEGKSEKENKPANTSKPAKNIPSCGAIQNNAYTSQPSAPPAPPVETSIYLEPDLNSCGDFTGHYETIGSPPPESTYYVLDGT